MQILRPQAMQAANMIMRHVIFIYFADNDEKVIIECDGKSKDEIHDHFKQIMGKSE
jgi:very-short-patch-repair endonuclease